MVRQAWAYLLAADPQVMQKFWRVNKDSGIAINPSLPQNQASTNWLMDGKFGLTIINPIIFNDPLGKLVLDLLQEGYELYGSQYGWGEGWKYTNPPPDCLDGNMVRDAALRNNFWIESYGNNLPLNVKAEALKFMRWGMDFYTSYSCKSQIPFEP